MNGSFSRPAVGFFELFFRPWMRGRLHRILIAGLPRSLPPAEPLFLVANHVSWWDGFILREVQRALRRSAPLYTIMSSAELRRFPFFGAMGAIGIDAASPPSVARGIRLLQARLRRRPDAVVVYFPQGRIWPSHRRPLGFRPGIELFLRATGATALPVGMHLEPLNRAAPTCLVGVGDPAPAGEGSAALLEERVEGQLDGILALLAEHGEGVCSRWPGVHERLPVGRPTVGEVA